MDDLKVCNLFIFYFHKLKSDRIIYIWVYDGRTMAPKKSNTENTMDSSRANRLILPLTADNQIDWETLENRPSMKQQYLDLVNNDVPTLEHIGMSHDAGGSHDEETGEHLPEITSDNVKAVLDILSRTNALAFRMLAPRVLAHPVKSQIEGRRVPLEIDLDVAMSCFMLTKEQHAELDPRALRLAKKYMPAEAAKHLDIWLLVGMYLKFTADNGINAIKVQVDRDVSRIKTRAAQSAGNPTPVDNDAGIKPNGHAPEEGSSIGESFEPGNEASAV